MRKLRRILSIAGYVLVFTGLFFHIMRWPYLEVLVFSGLISYSISFILVILNKNNQDENNQNILDDL